VLDSDRRIWLNKKIDFTCIEMTYKDDIMEIVEPLELDDSNIENL